MHKNDMIKYPTRKLICPKARTAASIRRGDGRGKNTIFEPKKQEDGINGKYFTRSTIKH
jgi:hypothetical protein